MDNSARNKKLAWSEKTIAEIEKEVGRVMPVERSKVDLSKIHEEFGLEPLSPDKQA